VAFQINDNHFTFFVSLNLTDYQQMLLNVETARCGFLDLNISCCSQPYQGASQQRVNNRFWPFAAPEIGVFLPS